MQRSRAVGYFESIKIDATIRMTTRANCQHARREVSGAAEVRRLWAIPHPNRYVTYSNAAS